jgi:hypothetical protein
MKFFGGGGDIVRDATSNRLDLWYNQTTLKAAAKGR